MAPPKSSGASESPASGRPSSAAKTKSTAAMALYNWCRTSHDEDYIFSQQDLLDGGVIPNKDATLLIEAVQSLVNERLFRTHDLRAGGFGWKVVAHVSAEKYKDLSSDESLVYSVIESAAKSGAWIKTIKTKLNLHQKNVESSLKTLQQRGYIKQMSSVKFPNRRMYILSGLQPGEDALGGAWFTDGVLDQDLLEHIATAVEFHVSELSWTEVVDDESSETEANVGRKRKHPQNGPSAEARGKKRVRQMVADDDSTASDEDKTDEPEAGREPDYVPHLPDYPKYPTAHQLTEYINNSKFMNDRISDSNMNQLLDIMVYDDKLIKIPIESAAGQTTYKARRNRNQIRRDDTLRKRARNSSLDKETRLEASRRLELQTLGRGGMSEIPCGRCPVFDMCEPDGPINATNCEYFEQWFEQMERDQTKSEGLDF